MLFQSLLKGAGFDLFGRVAHGCRLFEPRERIRREAVILVCGVIHGDGLDALHMDSTSPPIASELCALCAWDSKQLPARDGKNKVIK